MKEFLFFLLLSLMVPSLASADDDGDGDDAPVSVPSAPSSARSGGANSLSTGSSSAARIQRETSGPRFSSREEDLDTEFDGTVYSEKCGAARAFRLESNSWAIGQTTRELKKLKAKAAISNSKPTGNWELDHANIYDAFAPDEFCVFRTPCRRRTFGSRT